MYCYLSEKELGFRVSRGVALRAAQLEGRAEARFQVGCSLKLNSFSHTTLLLKK